VDRETTAACGTKVQVIAFNQANPDVAAEYRTTWADVTSAMPLGWAVRLVLWAKARR
jgi:hypothetical protein